MTWKDLDVDILTVFADASRSRGHVRSVEQQRYLDGLPWSVRDDASFAMGLEAHDEPMLLTGPSWGDIEEYLWRFRQIQRLRARERNREPWIRRERYRQRREWRQNARGRVVAVRCCPLCRRMFAVTAYMESQGQVAACSPNHRFIVGRGHELITVGREKDTLTGWARRHGLTEAAVRYRLGVMRWPLLRALTTPPLSVAERNRPRPNSITQRAKAAGISLGTVRHRRARGMGLDEAITTSKEAVRRRREAASLSARAAAAGVKYNTVRHRIAAGLSEAEALSLRITPPGSRRWNGEDGPLTSAVLRAVAGSKRTTFELIACAQAAVPTVTVATVRTMLSRLVRKGRLARRGVPGAFTYLAMQVRSEAA